MYDVKVYGMCTQCHLICTNFFFLYNVHINECTLDIFDKPIQTYNNKKKYLTNVEILEQTASLGIFCLKFILKHWWTKKTFAKN